MAKSGSRLPDSPPPDSFERLVREFEKLPGIGRRSAERMAYFILAAGKDDAMALAYAIRDVKKNLHPCSVCGDLTEKPVCDICQDPRRDNGVICVVEWPREARTIEKSGEFKGRYHILMGRLSPLSGIEPADLRGTALIERVKSGAVKELVMATSPTVEGDATAVWIVREVKTANPAVIITRLARGVPEGSDLSFAQRGTIGEALRGRTELSLPGGR